MLKMKVFSPIKYLVESIKVQMCLIKKYQDVLPVPARAGDVLLQVAGEALDGEAAGHQLLHHQHHLPHPHPSQPWTLFFINTSLCLPFVYFCFIYFIFSVFSHCHKKILNTESSLILTTVLYIQSLASLNIHLYIVRPEVCVYLHRILNFCVVLIVLLYSVVWCRLKQCSG